MDFVAETSLERKISFLQTIGKSFKEKAAENDRLRQFPFENIEALRQTKYTQLTTPKAYGGAGISLYEFVRLQETLAQSDGATALAIGWHMGNMFHLSENQTWDESLFHDICQEVKQGALLNVCATEKATGSPTRGGKPTTTATKSGNSWIINGRKSFSTMSEVLDYFIVTATIDSTEEIGSFIVPRKTQGVHIEKTWDSIAMQASGSHDLVLEQVTIPFSFLAEKNNSKKAPNGSLLHIPAVYLGVAGAAAQEAVTFAREYTPNSLTHPIAELPTIQQKIGKMHLLLLQSRHFLYSAAKEWDHAKDGEKDSLVSLNGAVKVSITNTAQEIVDTAMRIVGAHSLSEKSPLQRYYRDVRAGLHNPPMEDATLALLATRFEG